MRTRDYPSPNIKLSSLILCIPGTIRIDCPQSCTNQMQLGFVPPSLLPSLGSLKWRDPALPLASPILLCAWHTASAKNHSWMNGKAFFIIWCIPSASKRIISPSWVPSHSHKNNFPHCILHFSLFRVSLGPIWKRKCPIKNNLAISFFYSVRNIWATLAPPNWRI